VQGIPGNALGAYLNGASLIIQGNAQDATGDTMNEGKIIIHGSSGDATGYAMRGGKIFVKGAVGYRAGIHMKAYQTRIPVLTIGATAGCFLGEYQAGGLIIVLNLENRAMPVGEFCGTGMHGGKIFICCQEPPKELPDQVMIHEADQAMLEEIKEPVAEFCRYFGYDMTEILTRRFYILTPNTKNPYRQLYTHN
jgi:glutamate synthase domain-containing protein 3